MVSQTWIPYIGAFVISFIIFVILIPKCYNSLLLEVAPYWGGPITVAVITWAISFIVIGYIMRKYCINF